YACASGDNPDREQHDEVRAVKNFKTTAHGSNRVTKNVSCGASGTEASDLQPGRRFFRTESSRDIKLTRFFAAEFAAGSFGNAAGRNQFNAVGRKTEAR